MPLSRTLGLGLAAAFLLAPTAGLGAPLNLAPGDVVSVVEWDALKSNGDGGSYDEATGDADVDGNVPSVTVQNSVTKTISNTSFELDATLDSVDITPNFGGQSNLVFVVGNFTGVGGPDLEVGDGTGTILTADLTTDLQIGGVVDLNNLANVDTSQLQATDIQITGGDTDLVNALGSTGTLELQGTLSEFDPTIQQLITGDGDNDPFDTSFSFSAGGIVTPTSPSAFVPEPGTALLLASGLAGLGFAARRRS